jgi:hypothetical protein
MINFWLIAQVARVFKIKKFANRSWQYLKRVNSLLINVLATCTEMF